MLVPVFLLAACQAVPTVAPPNLGIANDTSVTVTLFVNGASLGDVPPGSVEPTVDEAALPSLPWTVTVRSASGQSWGRCSPGPPRATGPSACSSVTSLAGK